MPGDVPGRSGIPWFSVVGEEYADTASWRLWDRLNRSRNSSWKTHEIGMHRGDFLDNGNFFRFQLLIDFDLLRGLFVPVLFVPVLFVPVLFELIPLCG